MNLKNYYYLIIRNIIISMYDINILEKHLTIAFAFAF